MRYTTVTKRDTITPSNYRIIGKDTFIIPAQYSTKTEQIVIKEDISPGTPVSILSLDTHMATQTIPTSYKATFVRTSETQPNSTEKSVKSQNIKSSVSNSPSTNSETKRPVKKTIKKPVKKN